MTRLLLVEDDPQMLRALSLTLAARGFEVVGAATGADALPPPPGRTSTRSSSISGCRT